MHSIQICQPYPALQECHASIVLQMYFVQKKNSRCQLVGDAVALFEIASAGIVISPGYTWDARARIRIGNGERYKKIFGAKLPTSRL